MKKKKKFFRFSECLSRMSANGKHQTVPDLRREVIHGTPLQPNESKYQSLFVKFTATTALHNIISNQERELICNACPLPMWYFVSLKRAQLCEKLAKSAETLTSSVTYHNKAMHKVSVEYVSVFNKKNDRFYSHFSLLCRGWLFLEAMFFMAGCPSWHQPWSSLTTHRDMVHLF